MFFLQHLWKLTPWSCLCDFRCGSSAPCSPLWTRGASRTARRCPSIWRCVSTLRESPGRRRFTCRVSERTSKPSRAAKLPLWLACSSRRGSWCKALIRYYKTVTLLRDCRHCYFKIKEKNAIKHTSCDVKVGTLMSLQQLWHQKHTDSMNLYL